jgi:predicted outer membrane protein
MLRQIAVCLAWSGALAFVPAWTCAQTTLPASTKVDPGSPASGFAATAYAEENRDFQHDVRELDAAQANMAAYAERKASPAVQAFAKEVRMQFAGGGSSLKGMSDDQGVPLVGTAALSREHRTLLTQLQADGADVDLLFVDYEVLLLKEALGMVETYATGGTDARWRESAAKAVSQDRTLLAAAQTMQSPTMPRQP